MWLFALTPAFAQSVIELDVEQAVVLDNSAGDQELWALAVQTETDVVPLDVLADALIEEDGPDLWTSEVELTAEASGQPTGKRQHKPMNDMATEKVTCWTILGVRVCVVTTS